MLLVVVDAVADEDEDQHGGERGRHRHVVHLVQVDEEVTIALNQHSTSFLSSFSHDSIV